MSLLLCALANLAEIQLHSGALFWCDLYWAVQ